MLCPKCNNAFRPESFLGLNVDRCTGCKGLLCEADTLELLKGQRLSSLKQEGLSDLGIDTGYPRDSKNYDKIDNINCPACAVRMDKISDVAQPHIWMEACPQCKKVFLDAGEINDLRSVTLFDKVRDLIKGPHQKH